jgi:hypothetical protein
MNMATVMFAEMLKNLQYFKHRIAESQEYLKLQQLQPNQKAKCYM